MKSQELSPIALAGPARPVIKNDFRLWMAHGTGLKKNAKGKEEPVDWHACLVEPLKPVEPTGHTVFVAIGPRGKSRLCEKNLLSLTQTIAPSEMGATPTKIKMTIGAP